MGGGVKCVMEKERGVGRLHQNSMNVLVSLHRVIVALDVRNVLEIWRKPPQNTLKKPVDDNTVLPSLALVLKVLIIIIIMEICKAPTLPLKALNKYTHVMYIEMENVIKKNIKNKYVYIDKCSSIIMQKMHTHTFSVLISVLNRFI